MNCPTITALHAILAAYDAPAGPSKADTIKAVAACLSGACAAPQCEPGINQLTTQLHDDEKWTPEEQRQFAVFLQRFPNESSAGIMSLGSAWKHGKAIAQPVAAQSEPVLMAYIATDLDGHADVGMTIEDAKRRAGPGCDTIIALHDISTEYVELEGKPVAANPAILAAKGGAK